MSGFASRVRVLLDLFAGIGGWTTGGTGIELDNDAVATRKAVDLPTLQADVARTQPAMLGDAFRGVPQTASPPCQPFSNTGRRAGFADLELLEHACRELAAGRDSRWELRRQAADERSLLTVEPLRFALALEPEWVAWEQVVGVMPIWALCGDLLAERGYSAWTGILDAYEYGVAQTRRRAILMASRVKLAAKPEAKRYRRTMRDELGYSWEMTLRMGRSRGTARTLDQPAPTIMFGKSPSGVSWHSPDGTVRAITLEEALVLQGFRPDYPVKGGNVARFSQVGNAMSPPLARAITEAIS